MCVVVAASVERVEVPVSSDETPSTSPLRVNPALIPQVQFFNENNEQVSELSIAVSQNEGLFLSGIALEKEIEMLHIEEL